VNENHVSREVEALLERMDQFPHEFLDSMWGRELREAFIEERGELLFLLTVEERQLLESKYRQLLRGVFKEKVIERIINPKTHETHPNQLAINFYDADCYIGL